jgi:integrase
MASISTDRKGNKRILFTNGRGERKALYLGRMSMHAVRKIKVRVEELNAANAGNHAPDAETAAWVAGTEADLAAKLAAVRLIPERTAPDRATLGHFVRGYIESRTDVKPRTRINLEQAERRLNEFFGEALALESITPADVDRWAISLKERYAEATAARTIKRARQFFTAARRGRLLDSNPFEEVKPGSMHNPERLHFITREDAFKLIDAAPCADWRALIALVRFGGLRCPSEPLALTWADIDWDRGRFLVRSSKLEHMKTKGKRWVPLFPELRPYLDDLFHHPNAGPVYVINRYRDSAQNLRTTFEKIIDRAGLLAWPRLFQNLRASRETELAGQFPLHVVASWIGNSAPVAAKHYLSVTDLDFDKALRGDAHSDAPATQNTTQPRTAAKCPPVPPPLQTKMPQGFRHPAASQDISCTLVQMPLVGLEPTTR